MKQPNWAATSPMTAVQTPIIAIETKKQRYPLKRPECVFSDRVGKKVNQTN